MLKGFRDFISRGNVIDLAVAVIIGAAFNQIVASFVSDIFTPILGALGGAPDFSAIKLGPMAVGKFINAIVNFLIVSSVIYFFVVVPINNLTNKRKKDETTIIPPEPPEEVKLLREILETLKKRP